MRGFWRVLGLAWLLACSVAGSRSVKWSWVGGVTSESVEIRARLFESSKKHAGLVHVSVERVGGGKENASSLMKKVHPTRIGRFGMAAFRVEGLMPNERYTYAVHDESVDGDPTLGGFGTPAKELQEFSFQIGFASCADNKSDAVVFDVLRKHDPLLFLQTGDLHYGNVEINDEALFHEMYDMVFSSPRQHALYSNVATAWMWDDHDFGPNNSNEKSPSREASIRAFLETAPTYELPAYKSLGDPTSTPAKNLPSVYFAFTVGRVRFIVTDTSSAKREGETALGKQQLQWFKNELETANDSHGLIVWVTTMPWVTTHSKWGAFPDERADIVEFISSRNISSKLVQISGDAHMLALDDGENVPGGFPVFQAAALDAKPTCKGGPYSHGIFPGRGQYGWLNFTDLGDKICSHFQGRRVDLKTAQEQVLLEFDTCDPSKNSPRRPYLPSPTWIEKLWKEGKKIWLPESAMEYLDSFTFSTRMFFGTYVVPLVAIAVSIRNFRHGHRFIL